MKIRVHDLETNQVIERDMNAEELAQWNADKALAEEKAQEAAELDEARQALLDRLGITQEEARLLLGGNP